MPDLPEFDNPPVAEVAIGIQFLPIFGIRGLAVAPLRERWREQYPRYDEQPPLAPAIEGSSSLLSQLQLNLVTLPAARQWFLNDDGTELVQLQQDRLLVNWRAEGASVGYPRYGHMRKMFVDRFNDLAQFVAAEQLGEVEITQAELSYINVIETGREDLGRMDLFLRSWSGAIGHHLGEPEQSRMTLRFGVDDLGQPPVRLYVEVNPAQRQSGEPVLFFTLTIRGNPGGRSLAESLKFIDEAHNHLVMSFAELTRESMHQVWGKRK